MSLTSALQSAELWPITAKNKVTNWKPFGDSQIETFYHTSLEDGRRLQKSIADANNWLIQRKNQVQTDIQHIFNQIQLGTDGKLDNPARAIKYGFDIINFMQQVSEFQKNITSLASALAKNVGILQSMEANILAMIQSNLNAVASILHDICNWGLPDLPAIPNLFSDGIWNWNGFNFFPLSSFIPHLSFDFNFAFNQCQLHVPNVNILRNFPTTVQSYDGLTFGTPLFIPPLDGLIPNIGTDLSDPNFINQMQATTSTPYFTNDPTYTYPTASGPVSGAFNPQTSMIGSLPDPHTVISNYQMPAATYQQNVASTVPGLLPDIVATSATTATTATFRKDLTEYVTLGAVVASNFDPNITSAWIFYVSGGRGTSGGRAGNWLPNFQAAFQQYVQPSLDYLSNNPVPWNNVLVSPPAVQTLHSGPHALPLIQTLASAAAETQGNILWQLSYIEAAILGYTRNTTWDGFANTNYVGSFTGTDLDYASLTIDFSSTETVTLGLGEASSPVPCIFPVALGKNLQAVILLADAEIQLDTAYQSVHPQNRYVYDQFAVATQVDRFSQFWRDFNTNLQALLVQDPYLVGYACAYPQSLDSAIDPLGDPAIYNAIKADVASRNRTWVPGFPLLDLPTAPLVTFTNSGTPTSGNNGWTINPPNPPALDPVAFLARPDIQGQPIPVQSAMLKCNFAAASLMQYQSTIQAEIQDAINLVQQQIQSVSDFGFQVESATVTTPVPAGPSGTPIAFDQIDFDITGYVTSQTTFTVRASGAYVVSGQLNWDRGPVGTRTVTVFDGATPILTASTPPVTAVPVTLPFVEMINLTEGDILTVVGTHDQLTAQNVLPGSIFTVVLYLPNASPAPVVVPTSNGTRTFVADADMPALTAIYVTADGGVYPIDPTTVTINGSSLSPPFAYDMYPFIDGVTLTPANTGDTVLVAIGYGSVFQVAGAGFIEGGLLYAGPSGGSPPVTGGLTQDFEHEILTSCKWIIVAGRALDSQTFVYEPHIPSRLVTAF